MGQCNVVKGFFSITLHCWCLTTDLRLDQLWCHKPLRNDMPRCSRYLPSGNWQRLWFFQREARPRGGWMSRRHWQRIYVIERLFLLYDVSVTRCSVLVCVAAAVLLLSMYHRNWYTCYACQMYCMLLVLLHPFRGEIVSELCVNNINRCHYCLHNHITKVL